MNTPLHTSITDQASLRTTLNTALAAGLGEFITRTTKQRSKVLKMRMVVRPLLAVCVLTVLALVVGYVQLEAAVLNQLMMLLLLLISATMILVTQLEQQKALLLQEIRLALVPSITATLKRLLLFTSPTLDAKHMVERIGAIGILPEAFDHLTVGDVYTLYEPTLITHESIVIAKKETSQHHRVFEGMLITVQLTKPISGKVIITTKDDERYFGDASVVGTLQEAVSVVDLEWGDFGKDLHVVATSQIDARTVLTPTVMAALYDWWKVDSVPLRMVFAGDTLHVLFPYEHTATIAITKVDVESVSQYAYETTYPLWRSITLIERLQM